MNRGRGRGGGYQNNYNNGFNAQSNLARANDFQNQNSIVVEIQGWNNASETDLINFVSRKFKVILTNPSVNNMTGAMTASVRSLKDAETLVQYSGTRFAGNALKMKIIDDTGLALPSNGAANNGVTSTIELLKTFLRNRYNPNIKLLDMGNMYQDQLLLSNGLFSTQATSSKMFPALMKLALQLKLEVDSINLANNNFGELSQMKHINELGLTFPNLKNLALSNNNITKIDFFEKCKNRFNNLRELLINDNPILIPTNPSQSTKQILINIIKIFPRLVVINGEKIRNEDKLNQILSFPIPKKQMFFENGDLQKTATSFISTFINMWDTSRLDLLQLYTDESQFSYHFDASHIVDPKTPATTMGTTSHPTSSNSSVWGNYINNSRNLTRVSGAKTKMSKLSKGPSEIGNTFQSLPKTNHDLLNHPENFSMEAWSFPLLGGMQIVLHGEFIETGQPENNQQQQQQQNHNGVKGHYRNRQLQNSQPTGLLEPRSFDRNFIVVPGPNGNFIIASDMLLLKSYAGNTAFIETQQIPPQVPPSSVTQTPPPSSSHLQQGLPNNTPPHTLSLASIPPELENRINQDQKLILLKIISETKLNFEFGYMLSEQSNWNYEVALQAFHNSKSQIPQHAYLA